MADPQIFEGWSAHAIHCDEEVSEAIFNTLLARLTDFSGRLILSFTTLQGYTPLINSLLKGAETVKTKYSSLLNRELPIEQVSANWPDCRIYYFWSEMSPFVNANELIRTYSKQPLEVKLARLYGIPSKAVSRGVSQNLTERPMSYPMRRFHLFRMMEYQSPATSLLIQVAQSLGFVSGRESCGMEAFTYTASSQTQRWANGHCHMLMG
jgi:hypothetical protein